MTHNNVSQLPGLSLYDGFSDFRVPEIPEWVSLPTYLRMPLRYDDGPLADARRDVWARKQRDWWSSKEGSLRMERALEDACAVAGRGRGDHTFRNAFRDAWMGQDRKASQHPRAESAYAEGWAAGLASTTARRQQPADSSASGGLLASAGPSLGRGA